MLVPCGVTPPPIISAIEPVTTTAGSAGSSASQARFIASSVPATQLVLAQPGDHDRQFMRRQRVGVVQHGGHRQVLAADRAVDDDLQALDGAEGVDRPPVAAGAVVILDQHASASFRAARTRFACANRCLTLREYL